jgi:hypothetical protein
VSQTVYDVVKNRLGVKVTYLGPRELKNIREAVPVYQILLDVAAAESGGAVVAKKPCPKAWKWGLIGSTAVLVVAAAAAGIWVAMERSGKGTGTQPATNEQLAATGDVTKPTSTPAGNSRSGPRPDGTTVGPREDGPPPDARPEPEDPPKPKGPSPEEVARMREEFLPAHDFDGFAKWLKSKGLADGALARNYERLARFKGIVRIQLMNASKEDPIRLDIPDREGGRKRLDLWADDRGTFWVQSPGQEARQLSQIPAGLMAAAYRAIARTPEQRRLAMFLIAECRRAGLLERP